MKIVSLQNVKDRIGMTFEMINAARNRKEWKKIVCQLQIADATNMDESIYGLTGYFMLQPSKEPHSPLSSKWK